MMLKNSLFVLLFICFGLTLSAQADIPKGWNWSVNEGGKIGIHHTEKVEDYTAHVTVFYNDQHFNTMKVIEAGEWGFVNFPEDFGFTTEDVPAQSGTIKAKLIIEVGSDLVCDEMFRFTARNANQAYDVNIEEIEDLINVYGNTVDDCIFWHDYKGYNYVVRTHNANKGVFIAHWVVDVSSGAERLSYYKSTNECSEDKELIQYHSIGWKLDDANKDGYMEFYSLVFDGCEESKNHPVDAVLLVCTANLSHLSLKGESFSLLDSGEVGGTFEASDQLKTQSEILKAAEAAWEVYIME